MCVFTMETRNYVTKNNHFKTLINLYFEITSVARLKNYSVYKHICIHFYKTI